MMQNEIDTIYKIIDELKEEIHQRDIQLVKISERLNVIQSYQEKCDIRYNNLTNNLNTLITRLEGYVQDLEWVRTARRAIIKLLFTTILALLSTLGQWLLLLLGYKTK